ncbi:MAG TPA: 2-oxoglutarate and iron-dependent oxygenase domain-containing protein [Candidatus Saccharimonadales bacterium]
MFNPREVPTYPPAEFSAPKADSIDVALGTAVLDVMREVGFVNLRLDPEQNEVMEELFAASQGFFAQPLADRMRHIDEPSHRAVGYRPHGAAYTGERMKLDWNDSLITRRLGGKEVSIPGDDDPKIARLITAMGSFRDLIAAPAVRTVDAALAVYYDYMHDIPSDEGSVVQINDYCLSDERGESGVEDIPLDSPEEPELQGEHEDGVRITVLSSNWHGLVGRTNNGLYVPINHGSKGKRAVSVFAGGVLEESTAGEIRAFRHKAYNYMTPESDARRFVPTYFSSPDVHPGVVIPAYKGDADVAASAEEATKQFGIGENFVNRGNLSV